MGSIEQVLPCAECGGKGYMVSEGGKTIAAIFSLGISLAYEGGRNGFSSYHCHVCSGKGMVKRIIETSTLNTIK